MTQQLAMHHRIARRQAGRNFHTAMALVLFGAVLASGPVWAQGAAIEPPPAAPEATALPPAAPPPASTGLAQSPALDLQTPAPAEPTQPSVFRRWWFWTAVGAAAAATVAVIVISSRGDAPPATDLGNQEFQP